MALTTPALAFNSEPGYAATLNNRIWAVQAALAVGNHRGHHDEIHFYFFSGSTITGGLDAVCIKQADTTELVFGL
jgi:hypothetical protein